MRLLTAEEIEMFASTEGVNRLAVENFLGTMGTELSNEALANLELDAIQYNWNRYTIRAIAAGILIASVKD